MKQKTYFSITLIISLLFCVIYFYATQSSIKNEADEHLKIIVNLDTAIISDNTYITHASNIKQEKIRALLLRFNVKKIQAVYRNRYNEKGNLKPRNYTDSTGIWQQIILDDNSQATEFITFLKKEKGVLNAYLERPLPFKPCIAPNDAQYQSQWHLNSISSPMADIRAEQAWDINKGRSDVIIAVCDGGVDYTHPDLDPGDRSRVIAGYDSGDDDNDPLDDLIYNTEGSFGGHGTHVAGIIGAITNNGSLNNGENVAGVMWNCKIMPVKMVGGSYVTVKNIFGSASVDYTALAFPSDVADAIDYAVNNGAHVINLSYGFNSWGGLLNDVFLRVPLLYQAILNAYNHNVVVVAAMGNEYNIGNPIEFPAFFRIVIAVGATTNANPPVRWSDSNTGSHISVCAPGDYILSTLRGGSTGNKSGTSMAAPIVSGVAGLIISQGLDRGFNLTNDDVRHILERTADDITSTGIGFDNETGYGKVNAYSALSLLNTPNVLYHGVSIGGTSVKLSTINQWIYYGPQWGLASGIYYDVDQYQITKHITFDVPFCSVPQVWMRDRESTCLGFGNPNDGYPYAIISNITNTGFDVKFATYYVRYNTLGQTFNRWVPVEPASLKIAYSAIGQPNLAGTAGPVSGSNFVCSSNAIFTVNNLPIGSTIIWNNSSNLSRISNQGTNPCTFTTAGSGTGWIEATIPSTGCGDIILPRKNVWVGPPIVNSITGPSSIGTYLPVNYYAELSSYDRAPDDFFWGTSPLPASLTSYGDYANIMFTSNGSYQIVAKALNTCGWSDYAMTMTSVGGSYYMNISPNPGTNEAEISIASESEEKMNAIVEWELEVFNQGQVLKNRAVRLKDKKHKINIQGWKDGIYIVRAKINGEIVIGKLIVKK